ncbi:MAG: sulfotransferase [Hyphomicrobiales bacterium]|nr:sulfotransferase [Hyphomicrobiales bacterium]
MADPPIFLLGVGAQKSGTSWLYEQLAAQTEIMMSPIKELHYWDRRFRPDFFTPRKTRAILRHLVKQRGDGVVAEPQFERVVMDCDEQYYLAFFRSRLKRHHRVLGEISPSYSILSADEFRYIRDFLPFHTKAVFLMRDPVERTWSQCRMHAKNKAVRHGRAVSAHDLFRKSAGHRKTFARTDYGSAVRNLLAAFPREDVLFGFYETFFTVDEVDRLARFIGLDRLAFDLDAHPNKGAELERPDKADWDRVASGFAAIYDFVFETFGDQVPDSWRRGS